MEAARPLVDREEGRSFLLHANILELLHALGPALGSMRVTGPRSGLLPTGSIRATGMSGPAHRSL